MQTGALQCHAETRKTVSLPEFPDFRLIGLEDRDLFTAALARDPSEACEMHFANLFVWRHFEHPKFTAINGNLCVLCEPPQEPAYFLRPIGENDVQDTLLTCLSLAPRLSRVEESFVTKYCAIYRCEPDRDNFDYVYRAEDLAQLRGKKYDGKRNLIHKFNKFYAHEYALLSPNHLSGCRELLLRWLDFKAGSEGFACDAWRAVIEEGLDHFHELGLSGGVFTVDGRMVAFSLGAKLTPDVAIIPIEVVDPDYAGLSQLVNREFVRREWADCGFINREQDNGISGLRRAKSSYHPHHFVKKYNIWG